MQLRRITGVAFVATMAAFVFTQPSMQAAAARPALIGWAAAHFFGTPEAAGAVAGGAAGTDITNIAKDGMSDWVKSTSAEMGGAAGVSIDDLAIAMADLDPVVVLAAADAGAAITGLGAAEVGATVGAQVGSVVAPVIGTIVGAAVGAL